MIRADLIVVARGHAAADRRCGDRQRRALTAQPSRLPDAPGAECEGHPLPLELEPRRHLFSRDDAARRLVEPPERVERGQPEPPVEIEGGGHLLAQDAVWVGLWQLPLIPLRPRCPAPPLPHSPPSAPPEEDLPASGRRQSWTRPGGVGILHPGYRTVFLVCEMPPGRPRPSALPGPRGSTLE